MKKAMFLLIAGFLFFSSFATSEAGVSLTTYFFYGSGCPHCEKEIKFLENLQKKYPEMEIQKFEVYLNRENALLLQNIGKSLNVDVNGVPFSVIGGKNFIGYGEGITSVEIENQVKKCLKEECPDPISKIMQTGIEKKGEEKTEKNDENESGKTSEKIINLPFLGSVDALNFSLPVLTIIMGFLDGFNPCAMWALLFLISLLLGIENRKKMWTLGIVFIMASAFVYFIFMAAWLNLILFLGFIVWVRTGIGILALSGGVYSLKKFLTEKDSGCKVTGTEKRQKFFQKLKNIVNQNNFWIALGGIIILAFMVNLVELICSAGLPAVYTQVLVLNGLPAWQYYLYILLYILFFMLDDLFVFFAAMITLEMTGITTKYSRYSQAIGGVIMVIIGILLIFKPQWLMFG